MPRTVKARIDYNFSRYLDPPKAHPDKYWITMLVVRRYNNMTFELVQDVDRKAKTVKIVQDRYSHLPSLQLGLITASVQDLFGKMLTIYRKFSNLTHVRRGTYSINTILEAVHRAQGYYNRIRFERRIFKQLVHAHQTSKKEQSSVLDRYKKLRGLNRRRSGSRNNENYLDSADAAFKYLADNIGNIDNEKPIDPKNLRIEPTDLFVVPTNLQSSIDDFDVELGDLKIAENLDINKEYHKKVDDFFSVDLVKKLGDLDNAGKDFQVDMNDFRRANDESELDPDESSKEPDKSKVSKNLTDDELGLDPDKSSKKPDKSKVSKKLTGSDNSLKSKDKNVDNGNLNGNVNWNVKPRPLGRNSDQREHLQQELPKKRLSKKPKWKPKIDLNW